MIIKINAAHNHEVTLAVAILNCQHVLQETLVCVCHNTLPV